MEKIKVACGGCQTKLAVPETAAGKTIRCPKCQSPVQIPAVSQSPIVSQNPAASRARTAPQSSPAKRQAADVDRPKSRSSRQTENRFDQNEDSDLEFIPSGRQADALDWQDVPASGDDDYGSDFPYQPPGSMNGTAQRSRSSVNSKAVYSGIGMIVLSIVWFFGALLFLDRIFFYPPILLIIGIVTMVKGFKGED